MLLDSQQKEAAPTTHKQLYSKDYPTTALLGRLQRQDQEDPSPSGEKKRNVNLSHVSDKIAKGKVDFDIDCQYQLIELQAEDITKDLLILKTGAFRWRTEPTRFWLVYNIKSTTGDSSHTYEREMTLEQS